jgi:hypothetical protein
LTQPRKAEGSDDYRVAGETWPAYIPPELMTEAQAEQVRLTRGRLASDEVFRRNVDGARNDARRFAVVRGVLP